MTIVPDSRTPKLPTRSQTSCTLYLRSGSTIRNVDVEKIAALRNAGRSWSEITRETGLTKGTAQRAFYSLPKKGCDIVPASR